MSEELKYYKGTYMVTILADRPLLVGGLDDLRDAINEGISGDFISYLEGDKEEEIPALAMAHEVERTGSDPQFFGLSSLADLKVSAIELDGLASQEGCDAGLVVVDAKALNQLLGELGIETNYIETHE